MYIYIYIVKPRTLLRGDDSVDVKDFVAVIRQNHTENKKKKTKKAASG